MMVGRRVKTFVDSVFLDLIVFCLGGQVATTTDFSHNSFFWTHFSGGLNYQVSPRLLFGPES